MKNKLISLFYWIAKHCQQDKLLHNKFGNFIGFFMTILSLSLGFNLIVGGLIGFLMATLIGIIKDYWFDVKVQKEPSDILDVVATSIGGLEVLLFDLFVYIII